MGGAVRTTIAIQPLACVVALLATAAIAFFLGGRFERQLPAILIAGLAVPGMMLLATLYAVVAIEGDWPSPGTVLLRALPAIGVTAVVTLATSGIMVRLAQS